MEGAWKQGERAGTGKGAALPSSWKTKQALNPFLVEPALLDAQGAVVSGVPFPSCRSSRAKTCPFVPDFCRASLEVQQSPSSRLCRQGPRSTGIFPGWQPAPTHQLSQFRSRELFPSSPTSASACPRAPVWGQDGAVPVSLGTLVAGRPAVGWGGEAELLWQWLV